MKGMNKGEWYISNDYNHNNNQAKGKNLYYSK